MKSTTLFVGMDVHKESISISVLEGAIRRLSRGRRRLSGGPPDALHA